MSQTQALLGDERLTDNAWTFTVQKREGGNTWENPYPFTVEAVSKSDGKKVYGFGDSELGARQDCYIQIGLARKPKAEVCND